MFIAPSDQMLLPLAVIDVSTLHSHRSTHTTRPVRPAARNRGAAALGAIEANVVRLIPGVTRLPLGVSRR